MNGSPRKSALGLVFLIVFLDIVGFSIVFPLFPQMLDHYVEREGEASLVGRLVDWLSGFSGGAVDPEFAVVTLFGSVLGSIYSLLQFLFAPYWGGLSDRIGRRPCLLITLAGTVLSYSLWFFAGSFLLLIVSRVLGGIMAGNISTASAVVADTSAAKDRAKGMGILGAGIGLGFVLGPAIGGIAAMLNLAEVLPSWTALGVNPFSAPAAAAFVLAVVNLVWVWRAFPETLPPERRGTSEHTRSIHVIAQLRRLRYPGVPLTNLVYYLFLVAFSAIEFTLTFLATERFRTASGEPFGPAQNAWMFVFVGVVIALVQGGFVRRVVPRYGERKVGWVGILLTVPAFVLVGVAHGLGMLYAGLFLMAVGSALVMPCLSALVSRYTPADRQGLSLGTFRSLGSLSRATGPLVGGVLYWRFGSATPYLAGAVYLAIPLLLALRLPPPPEGDATA